MKYVLSLLLISGTIFYSCKKDNELMEYKPLIDYDIDSSYIDNFNIVPQKKTLLIQEFTGVYCYTCPLAHDIMAELIESHPNQIAAMNIHSHFFSIYDNPAVMGNLYDFRTADGDSIVSMLGSVLSVPSAAFDMTLQGGEDDIASNARANWVGYANTKLSETPKINIDIATDFNTQDRNLKIVIKYNRVTPLNRKT